MLSNLNPSQREAVDCRKNLLIVAGAGTGKTKTIVSKICHYISLGIVMPDEIIATTFTNKATQEMHSRIKSEIGDDVDLISIGTFHRLSLKIVQNHAKLLNIEGCNLIAYEDQAQVMRKVLSNIKNKDIKPSHALETVQRAKEKNDYASLNHTYANIAYAYNDMLREMNALDFADLISKTIELWRNHKDILDHYRKKYKLICVDEYQDINDAQYEWISLLSCDDNQICCVGDPDQSIYSFRGSNMSHILNFTRDFKNSEKIVLEENYRSTDKIISNSNHLISKNKNRIEKFLVSTLKSDELVDIFVGMHGKEEAFEICRIIAKIKSKEEVKSSIALLFRTSTNMHLFEEALLNANIKYSIVGSVQFMDRAEIKDAVSYVRFLSNPNDFFAFSRMIQAPKRGIGSATVAKISENASSNIEDKIRGVLDSFTSRTKNKLSEFLAQWERWRSILSKDLSDSKKLRKIMEIIVNESGLYESLESDRKENVDKWLETLDSFEDPESYVNHILWNNLKADDEHDVKLMTVHAAKGLEFDYVFLPVFEDGIFPHSRSFENIEEERRLAYVALTRAKKKLFITYAQSRVFQGRYMNAQPSRFIREMDSKSLQFQSFKHKTLAGKKVYHEEFGYGTIEESGMQCAKVCFGSVSKVVDIKKLVECD
ncbi:ATP-dependent helicase [Candidatus Nesciobacter abundans]|uniref:DNA 3'-5' helicase n=1 Tax=Candidatus Nesciobacter abundans TaxID=2601668 RepID=A0A5C0UHR6_9PROT|nr:UvrD-helicase domain-containing protein [Candidatus Nesciobacter abundans]QEK39287.1 AAA family ATPase [Candidatus Nesciobacter abundans]